MKNENGITLIALMVIIIVLMILVGIVIYNAVSSLNEVADDKAKTELLMIQNAVIQQYSYAKTKNKVLIKVDENDANKPDCFVGSRIAEISVFLSENNFPEEIIDEVENTLNNNMLYYEDFYYSLNVSELNSIGIEKINKNNSNQNKLYIVNYSTGEVFDLLSKEYLKGTKNKIVETKYNFTDEQE